MNALANSLYGLCLGGASAAFAQLPAFADDGLREAVHAELSRVTAPASEGHAGADGHVVPALLMSMEVAP